MTTAQITGGAVEFSRPQNYSTDKSGAKVTLTFSCAEGATDEAAAAMLDKVISMAVGKAYEMVNGKITSRGHNDDAVREQLQLLRDVKQAVDTERAAAAPPTQPAPVVIGAPAPVATTTATSEAVATVEPASTNVGITDQQLREAVEHKVTKLVNDAGNDVIARQAGPVAVGRLIGSFVTPPQKVYAIPQEQRAVFLAGLAAL